MKIGDDFLGDITAIGIVSTKNSHAVIFPQLVIENILDAITQLLIFFELNERGCKGIINRREPIRPND